MLEFDAFPNGNWSSGLSDGDLSVNSSTRFNRHAAGGAGSKHAIFKKQRFLRYRHALLENLFTVYFYEDRTSMLACWVFAVSLGLPAGLPSMIQSETAPLAIATLGVGAAVWCLVCALTYVLFRQRRSLLEAAHYDVRSGSRTAAAPASRLWLVAKPFSQEWVLEANAKQQEWLNVIALLAGLLYAAYTYPARTVKCDPGCERYVDVDAIVLFFLPITVVVSPLRIALLAPLLIGIVVTFFAVRFIPGSLAVSFSLFSSFALVCLASTILTIISAFFNERWRREDFERIYLMHLDGETMAATRDVANTSVGYVIPADVARRVAAGEAITEVSHCASVAMFTFRNYFKESASCGAAELVQRQQWLAMILDARKESHKAILKFHNRGDVYMVATGPFAASILNLSPEPEHDGDDMRVSDRRRMLANMLFDFAMGALTQLQRRIEHHRTSNPLLNNGSEASDEAHRSAEISRTNAASRDVVCALDSSPVACLYRSSPANCLVLGNAVDGCRQLLQAATDDGQTQRTFQRHRCLLVSEAFERALRPRGGAQGVVFVDNPLVDDIDGCDAPFRTPSNRVPVRSAVVGTSSVARLPTSVRASGPAPPQHPDEETEDSFLAVQGGGKCDNAHGAPNHMQRPITPASSSGSESQQIANRWFYCCLTPAGRPPAANDGWAAESAPAVPPHASAADRPLHGVQRIAPLWQSDDDRDETDVALDANPFRRIAREVRLDRSYVGLLVFRRAEMESGYRMHLKELAGRGYTQWMFVCCAFMSLILFGVALIYRFGADQAEKGIAPIGGALAVDILSFIFAVFHSNGEHPLVFTLLFWVHCGLWYCAIALEPVGSLLHDEQLIWSCVVVMLGLLREPHPSVVLASAADFVVGTPLMLFVVLSDRTAKMQGYIFAGQMVMWFISVTTRVLLDRSLREQFSARVQSLLYTDELEKDYEAMTDLLTTMVPHPLALRIMEDVKGPNRRTSLVLRRGGKRFARSSCGGGGTSVQPTAAESCVVFPHVESFFTSRTLDTPFALISLRPRLPDKGPGPSTAARQGQRPPSEGSMDAIVQTAKQLSDVWSAIQTTLEEHHAVVSIMFTGDSCLLADEEHSFDGKFSAIFDAVRSIYAEVLSTCHEFADAKAVLHSGPLMGAVVGKLALSFEYYGESIGTAKALVEAMPFNGAIATERFCEQLRLTWLHGRGSGAVSLSRAGKDVSMPAVARHEPKAMGTAFLEQRMSWRLRGRGAKIDVCFLRFLPTGGIAESRSAKAEMLSGAVI